MPIHGLVRSPQRSKTIDAVRGRQLRRPYSLRAGSTTAAMVGSRPDVGAALSARLADKAGLKIGEPDLVWPLVDDVAAQDDVVAGIVQAEEDDETTNTGRAHLAQRDLHRAAIR